VGVEALHVPGVAAAGHPVAVVQRGVAAVRVEDVLVHGLVGLQHPHPAGRLEAADGLGQGPAGQPVAGREGPPSLVAGTVAHDRGRAEGAADDGLEAGQRLAADEGRDGLAVRRGR
jgi:hypothetical protein